MRSIRLSPHHRGDRKRNRADACGGQRDRNYGDHTAADCAAAHSARQTGYRPALGTAGERLACGGKGRPRRDAEGKNITGRIGEGPLQSGGQARGTIQRQVQRNGTARSRGGGSQTQ